MFFFFFQAEDGIRDYKVTGVQTCALPIWPRWSGLPACGPSGLAPSAPLSGSDSSAAQRRRASRFFVPRGSRRQGRSEEHTSELQSPCNLVCRLLLEKKKKNKVKIQVTTYQ